MKAQQHLLSVEELATGMSCRLLHYREDPNSILMSLRIAPGPVFHSERNAHVPRVFIAGESPRTLQVSCAIGALTKPNFILWITASLPDSSGRIASCVLCQREMQAKRTEIERQRKIHRAPHGLPELDGRNVLFVNDGTAASAELIASIESFRDSVQEESCWRCRPIRFKSEATSGIAWMISSLRIQWNSRHRRASRERPSTRGC